MEAEILKDEITPFFLCASIITCSQLIISRNLSVVSVGCQVGASSEPWRALLLTLLSLLLIKEEETPKKGSVVVFWEHVIYFGHLQILCHCLRLFYNFFLVAKKSPKEHWSSEILYCSQFAPIMSWFPIPVLRAFPPRNLKVFFFFFFSKDGQHQYTGPPLEASSLNIVVQEGLEARLILYPLGIYSVLVKGIWEKARA